MCDDCKSETRAVVTISYIDIDNTKHCSSVIGLSKSMDYQEGFMKYLDKAVEKAIREYDKILTAVSKIDDF